MKRLMMGMSLAIASLLFCGTATAQEEIEIEFDTEQIEQLAEELEAAAEQIGEQIEAWAEEHSEELEAWAERYSGQWEEWAEGFEKKMESWAEQQESVWEEWAESYSKKWEDWGSKLESGEFDPDEMGELIERNLEMLSEMPLGPMIEGLMKEGVGELKNAPWESLNDLQDLFQDSLEQSLKGMEGMAEEGVDSERLARSSDDFKGALEKMRKGLDVKLKRLDGDAEKKLGKLMKLLEDTDLTDEQRDKIRKAAETIKDATARRAVEMKDKAKASYERAMVAEKKAQAARRKTKAKGSDSESEALNKFNEALKARAKASEKKAKAERDAKESFIRDAKKKRESVKSKESELDALRAEIKKLREEVKKLKKDKDD